MNESDECTTNCPICDRENVRRDELYRPREPGPYGRENYRPAADKGWYYYCDTCGEYVLTQRDDSRILRNADSSILIPRRRLSILLQERSIHCLPVTWIRLRDNDDDYWQLANRHGEPGSWTPLRISELLSRWPQTVQEKLDRTLANVVKLSKTGGERITIIPDRCHSILADADPEAYWLIAALEEQGFLEEDASTQTSVRKIVTVEGWSRFEELQSEQCLPRNPVFVAQWFGDAENMVLMNALYNNGIGPAVKKAGYRVTRVDMEQFNDFIMDKVLSDIQLAPFVVADFSGNRNGVYFEAGFARGLRRPVIHTCRRKEFEQAHFDTKQLNHILWDEPSEICEKLFYRIVSTLGYGPYQGAQ